MRKSLFIGSNIRCRKMERAILIIEEDLYQNGEDEQTDNSNKIFNRIQISIIKSCKNKDKGCGNSYQFSLGIINYTLDFLSELKCF